MNRALLAGLVTASLLAPAVQAQSVQFMTTVPRAPASLLPVTRHWRGYAASGDLNGDGRNDLVAMHDFGASALLRSPTSWTELLRVYMGTPGQRPVLTDLDGDGDLDLALVPPHPSTQRPLDLYSNALGTMTRLALPAIMVGLGVQGVAVGRVDGDAFADFVVATPPSLGAPPLVLVRGGTGVQFTIDLLAMPAALPAGLWPELLDADGDGDLDVLATNATSGLCLLRNQGGAFVDATATLPPARTGHVFLVRGDLDGDGRDDCAATLQNGDVDVLWGAAGSLSFAPAVASVPGLRTVTPADFDGDGDLDLLAERALGLDVLWNRGNRQFVRAEVVAGATSMRGAVDIDSDGVADVVFAAPGAETLLRCRYRARHEDAAFAAGILPLLVDGVSIPAAGDVDGDGRTDLVTPEPGRIVVDHALGAGAYRRTVSPAVAASGRLWRTDLGDLDGDQDLDLVIVDDAWLSIARNDGTGTFSWAMQLPAASTGLDDMRLGDVDGDGDLDVVHATTAGVVLVRNLGGGQYASSIIPGHVTAPLCVELADVDGDGDLDLITNVTFGGGAQCIAANNGQGVFAPSSAHSLVLGGTAVHTVRAADFDADGDADVLAGGLGLRVFRNNGSGSFTDTSATDLPNLGLPFANSNIVVADLDDDGDLDAAVVLQTNADFRCRLFFNTGTGRFLDLTAQRSLPPNVGQENQLRAADLDDDGDIDLIARHRVFVYNHLRQCRSASLPTLGGSAALDLFSGPLFGQPGLGLLAFSAGPAAAPVSVPGVGGRLELDGATLQVAAAVATSSIGLSRVFVGVPNDAALFGLEVWFQGAIWPSAGAPPGFTNATREVVLR